MQKVDYISYYMGYRTLKDISANIMTEIFSKIRQDEENSDKCAFEIGGTCYGAPSHPTAMSYADCAGENATSAKTTTAAGKEASALGIKQCYYKNDYWAGAVKACGGVNKMPSLTQLAEIADYIYGTSGIGVYEDWYCSSESCRVSSLGFTLISGAFYVWSGEEYSSNNAYPRNFYATRTNCYNGVRNSSSIQAVCLGDNDDTSNNETGLTFCEKIRDTYNISESDCSIAFTDIQTGAQSGDFKELTPHITLSNGLKLYIASNYDEIAELNDSTAENDTKGFIVYIDVNGKSGKSKLWEDVFPYYLLGSGKIVPGYNPALNSGATNREHLSINVLYDNYTNDKREVKILLKDANFRSAACATGYVTSSKYCDGRVQYDICKETEHDCRFQVKTPVKIF